eukprot:4998011-Prymnesium_polylepis.1
MEQDRARHLPYICLPKERFRYFDTSVVCISAVRCSTHATRETLWPPPVCHCNLQDPASCCLGVSSTTVLVRRVEAMALLRCRAAAVCATAEHGLNPCRD